MLQLPARSSPPLTLLLTTGPGDLRTELLHALHMPYRH